MARVPVFNVADRWFANINTAMNVSVTSMVLKSSGATDLPTRTVISRSTEKFLVTDIATDTPSAGLDTLTVTRGYAGTTPITHAEDDQVVMLDVKEFYNDAADRIARLEEFLANRMGYEDGVMRGGLSVAAEGTPSMTVDIAAGGAIVSGQVTALLSATSQLLVAPVTNPRIDVFEIEQDGTVAVLAGTEDASPTAPAGTGEEFARVIHTTAETVIKDADDATNGYISFTGVTYI